MHACANAMHNACLILYNKNYKETKNSFTSGSNEVYMKNNCKRMNSNKNRSNCKNISNSSSKRAENDNSNKIVKSSSDMNIKKHTDKNISKKNSSNNKNFNSKSRNA